MNHDVHDVVVIGAGCSGLPCGIQLLQYGLKFIVIEEGSPPDDRDRFDSHSAAAGVGGAGLFSDGKFSFWPSGQSFYSHVGLNQLPRLQQSFEDVVSLLRCYGLPHMDFPSAVQSVQYEPGGWCFKHYPSVYLSLAQRRQLIGDLYSRVQQQTVFARVTGVEQACDSGDSTAVMLVTLTTQQQQSRVIRCRHVVIAGGRFFPLSPCLRNASARIFRRFEFGVRIEAPHTNPFFAAFDCTDPKLVYQGSNGVQWRTFCMCRRGEVVTTQLYGLRTLSGRSDCAPSERSNFGFMIRITDPAIAAAVAPAVLSCCESGRVFVCPLLDVLRSNSDDCSSNVLSGQWGATATQLLLSGLKLLLAAHTSLAAADVTLHGPCLEGVGEYFCLDEQLRVKGYDDAVSVIGDATGIFRGIVPAMVSGAYVARCLSDQLGLSTAPADTVTGTAIAAAAPAAGAAAAAPATVIASSVAHSVVTVARGAVATCNHISSHVDAVTDKDVDTESNAAAVASAIDTAGSA